MVSQLITSEQTSLNQDPVDLALMRVHTKCSQCRSARGMPTLLLTRTGQ